MRKRTAFRNQVRRPKLSEGRVLVRENQEEVDAMTAALLWSIDRDDYDDDDHRRDDADREGD